MQVDTLFAMDVAVVMLRSGDIEGYRRLARALLEKFADSADPEFLERTVKVNLLIPPAGDLKRLDSLAQRSVDVSEGNPYRGWFPLVRGMSACRSGEFATAVEWLDKAAQSDYGPESRSTRKSSLAMAKFRLGREQEARVLVLEAGGLIAARAAQKDVGRDWHNLQIAEIAHREAETLIGHEPPPPVSPAARDH